MSRERHEVRRTDSETVTIKAWYDVFCDADDCGDWTTGYSNKKGAAAIARAAGWKLTKAGWRCPECQKKEDVS